MVELRNLDKPDKDLQLFCRIDHSAGTVAHLELQ